MMMMIMIVVGEDSTVELLVASFHQ